ncbi:MAG: L-seryl-tRNA(Sec) selenium transferase, partial [Planctomycetes bacterium]|nr:L-seryl-tRNA(Sec) selenium transferase [Planctomycetota bacterium]
MKTKTKELLRSLPSISALLEHDDVLEWLHGIPRSMVVTSLQSALDSVRNRIRGGDLTESVDVEFILGKAEEDLVERSIPSIRRVINATGIVIHTGLGRAPLCEAAIEAVAEGAVGNCNLEYDLETGKRGKRHTHVIEHLTTITGAESATVVNNNAAATMLILQTLAGGKEVIVSRGQLVEIGGSFRIPDIMRASGAILHEVGTTNRTHAADYEGAINDRTAILMRVHTSNFRVIGFTNEVPITDMVEIAHRFNLPVVDDLGSGALFDLSPYGLPDEPNAREAIEAGADLVCFSGDKLLGGPQCGIIIGRRDLIDQLNVNPLMRTYRVDKMTLLALEATLRCYHEPEEAVRAIPTLAMLRATPQQLGKRASELCEALEAAVPGEKFLVCSDVGFAGGGSMPGAELETVVVQWRPASCSTADMVARLRDADVPVVARVRDDAICFDLPSTANDRGSSRWR